MVLEQVVLGLSLAQHGPSSFELSQRGHSVITVLMF
jgi:hypothetical protein